MLLFNQRVRKWPTSYIKLCSEYIKEFWDNFFEFNGDLIEWLVFNNSKNILKQKNRFFFFNLLLIFI